eukprot:340626-Pleurochrysis_carterae.AAC.2
MPALLRTAQRLAPRALLLANGVQQRLRAPQPPQPLRYLDEREGESAHQYQDAPGITHGDGPAEQREGLEVPRHGQPDD